MNSSRTTRLTTEVLVARPDPDRLPRGSHPRDRRLARRDLADHGERQARYGEEPGGEGGGGRRVTGQEELIVLAASRDTIVGIPAEGPGRLANGR